MDTGKVYAMKSLQKAEMLQRDQVRLTLYVLSRTWIKVSAVACPRPRRARRLGRIDLTMGRTAFLLVPRSPLSISHHGIPPRRRPHDYVDEV